MDERDRGKQKPIGWDKPRAFHQGLSDDHGRVLQLGLFHDSPGTTGLLLMSNATESDFS